MGIWGAATQDHSAGNHMSLTLTALYIGDPKHGVLLIVLDAAAWRRPEDEWLIRSTVIDATGLTADRVIFHLTHSHSTPSLCPDDIVREGGEFIEGYLGLVQERAVDAAQNAIRTAEPACIEWGRGSSRLAGVRDLPAGDRYLTGWNPLVHADDTLLVGRVTNSAGTVLATIVNYACHPTTLAWENHLVSPDYVGAMREVVETETHAPCLFLQGAEGDLAPREQYSGELELAERHGRGLGLSALAALATLPAPAELNRLETPIDAATSAIRLPLKPVESIPDLALRFWPELDTRTRESRVRRAEWRRKQAGTGVNADFPLWVWRLGDTFLVATPGEAYEELQRELRRRYPRRPLLVLSLANGPIWTYFPIAERFAHNVYQVWHTPFEVGGHEALVERADELLAELGA